ncbi:MAG: hypothetical protein IJT01_13705 [Selenomonadaceae bacterium]|nr:hypothetical protein [Selenomonadaceae bacterium]
MMNERGAILLETLISLPVIVFLISALGGCILWSFKTISWQKDDWELQQELHYVMERLVEDANRAEYAKITHLAEGDSVCLYYRQNMTRAALEKREPDMSITYAKKDSEKYGEGRMIVDNPSMPMTGDSIFGRVNITRFRCDMVSPHIMQVQLTGKSFLTKHEYTLETAVFMRGQE